MIGMFIGCTVDQIEYLLNGTVNTMISKGVFDYEINTACPKWELRSASGSLLVTICLFSLYSQRGMNYLKVYKQVELKCSSYGCSSSRT